MILWQLFLSFLKIGAFSFGGGYAAMPLIQEEIVEINQWLSMQEFTDLVTISEMTPGPIAINASTFVGTQIAGVPGALAATAGSVLPSIILVSFIAFLYLRYRNLVVLQYILTALRPAVVAMIATAGVSIIVTAIWGSAPISLASTSILAIALFAISLFLLLKTKMNPIYVMVLAGVLNVIANVVSQANIFN